MKPKINKKFEFVILPIPYERTTTFGKGTKNGPKAIIEAFDQVETFDEELKIELSKMLSFKLERSLKLDKFSPEHALNIIEEKVLKILKEKKFPIVLGGEHSISKASVLACKRMFKDLSVLQIDAHADLRNSYLGSKLNHACVMRRILEICPAIQAGIRNISEEEYIFAKESGQIRRIYFANQETGISYKKILKDLSENVYITMDVDGFDPSVVFTTGTPEPGGLTWHQVIALLKEVVKNKNVVGFDVVELSPVKGLHSGEFACAKLIYRLMGYIVAKLRGFSF